MPVVVERRRWLQKFRDRAARLIGVDLVDFVDAPPDAELHKCNLAAIPVADASVDTIMSRSVFEHLDDPAAVYREFMRVLKPGGRVVFLTPTRGTTRRSSRGSRPIAGTPRSSRGSRAVTNPTCFRRA
jgi:SAM-dependent methyltransferase